MTTSTNQIGNPRTMRYGDAPSQFGQLWLPDDAATRAAVPLVVLIHGGFWRAEYGLDLMDPLARDLNARGYAAWNIEYRRVGEAGGGYPGILDDVAAAIDVVASSSTSLDLDSVVFVGHSAGGQLALWAAGRAELPPGAPGADPLITPRLAIGEGPVFDLVAADAAGLGGGAVGAFLGGSSEEQPERYAIATPSTAGGVALVVIRGTADQIVPATFTVPTPPAGVRAIDVDGDDHFALIDPASASWATVLQTIEE